MKSGDPVVLFAEGTSSGGNRVLSFRSALVGAASEAISQSEGGVWLQPLLHGELDAVVTFGDPIAFDGGGRKASVKSLETAVRRMRIEALRGDFSAKAA